VKKDGRVIIPLSEIQEMILRGSRWITFRNQFGVEFIYEIYDLPPDRTGPFPTYVSQSWKKDIETVKDKSFGTPHR
jgi:hypothetical protein